jgi:hypothetical protein
MKQHSYIFYSLIIIFTVLLSTIYNSAGLNTIENFQIIENKATMKRDVPPEAFSNTESNKTTSPTVSPASIGSPKIASPPASLLQPEQSRMNYINQNMNVPMFASSEEKVISAPTNKPLNENSMYASAVDLFEPSSV